MTTSELHTHVLNAFLRHGKILFESEEPPAGLKMEILTKKTADHSFTGPEIWELYLATKREIVNSYNPLWNSKLVDGQIPSGKTKEDILHEMLNEMWSSKEQERVANLIKRLENI
eukprot:3904209-Rhodomonas_salina.1